MRIAVRDLEIRARAPLMGAEQLWKPLQRWL